MLLKSETSYHALAISTLVVDYHKTVMVGDR